MLLRLQCWQKLMVVGMQRYTHNADFIIQTMRSDARVVAPYYTQQSTFSFISRNTLINTSVSWSYMLHLWSIFSNYTVDLRPFKKNYNVKNKFIKISNFYFKKLFIVWAKHKIKLDRCISVTIKPMLTVYSSIRFTRYEYSI